VGLPLDGVQVLDLSRMVSGPLCGRILSDLGAEVLKIEPPDGDRTRTVPPFVNGMSPYFAQANAGKRSVCLDLKAPGAPAVVARLVARADVFLENFRPGVLARYGLGAPTLIAANPRLVYCSVTGWGQSGSRLDDRAFAPLVHAEIGTLEFAARHRRRRPEPEVQQHGDVYPAVLAANAVLAALLQRERTGRGQHLDVAMGEAAFYVNEWAAVELQPHVDEYAGFDTWNQYTYPLGDGTSVALIGNPVALFPTWVRTLGGDGTMLTDPRFATPEARAEHVTAMNLEVERLTRRFADYGALEASVEDPWLLMAPVRAASDFARSAWASERGLTVEVAPGLPVPAAPWRSDAAPVGAPPHVADLGADNATVLAGAGFTTDEIEELTRNGALCGAPVEPRHEHGPRA
jgi:crotonobetainyl-CoA:carnitine CoA-transferase CaiB-like acyl-CoA transferase